MVSSISNVPSSPTTPVPITSPFGSVISTVAPGSPVPETMVPSSLISRTGASGAVVSGAVTVASGDSLPAASVCVPVSSSPLVCGVVS